MRLLLWRLLALSGIIIGSASIPTRLQEVLSVVNKGQELNPASFGVGFDLTASYGSAAVSFSNGTTVTLAKVLAEDGYDEVLQRLSLDSSRHLSPPYQHLFDSRYDMRRQLLRKARKAIGLPASHDVGLLAKMLSDLRSRVEEQIGMPVESAGVATLNLVALYQEDMQDAFEYVGLRYLIFPVRYGVTYETSAAYAGYKLGLCSDYTNRSACKQEQVEMRSEVVMAVLYTHFSLGYDVRPVNIADEGYWDAVGLKLEQLLIENPFYKRPAKVLLMGDCVKDRAFQRILKQALNRQMETLPEVLEESSEGVAAEGAAEFAKRMPYDPYRI